MNNTLKKEVGDSCQEENQIFIMIKMDGNVKRILSHSELKYLASLLDTNGVMVTDSIDTKLK